MQRAVANTVRLAKKTGDMVKAWCLPPRRQRRGNLSLCVDLCLSCSAWGALGLGMASCGTPWSGSPHPLSDNALVSVAEDMHSSKSRVSSICAVVLVLGMFANALGHLVTCVARILLGLTVRTAFAAGRWSLRLKHAAGRLSTRQWGTLLMCGLLLSAGAARTPSRLRRQTPPNRRRLPRSGRDRKATRSKRARTYKRGDNHYDRK